jgi:AcrR family transcriptional regulator
MGTATTRSPGRARRPLSRERVLASALVYVDEHGLDGLTMHNLAVELGVGDMSLYNHVKNKDDLLAGISELVWAEAAAAVDGTADEAGWLRSVGRAVYDAIRRHPNALPAVVSSRVLAPRMLEVVADRFDRSDSTEPDPRLVNAFSTVTAFALGWATASTGPALTQVHESERQRIRRVTRALPPQTPDRLVDAAIAVCGADAEAMFTSGLDAIINSPDLTA